MKKERKEKIKKGAKDFAKRFEKVMKELAEENHKNKKLCLTTPNT